VDARRVASTQCHRTTATPPIRVRACAPAHGPCDLSRRVTWASPATLPVEDAACLFCSDRPWAEIGPGRDYEYDTVPDLFTLRRCTGCGLVFVAPRPGPRGERSSTRANYYAYREEEIERPLLKRFRDRIEGGKGAPVPPALPMTRPAVVDVGCGDGRLLEILRRLGPSGWRLAGIEVAEAAARVRPNAASRCARATSRPSISRAGTGGSGSLSYTR